MSLFPKTLTQKNIQKRDDNSLYESFQPSLYMPTNAKLTSSVQALTGRYITELYSPHRRLYNEWIKMLTKDPVAGYCAAIKVLRAQITFGQYTNSNKEYQQFIRDNFDNMQGSFRNTLAELASSMTFGSCFAEVNLSNCIPGFRGNWMLKSINTLDIRNITVRGKTGRIEEIGYRDRYNNTVYIDYRKIIHVTNTSLIPFNTDKIWGNADSEKALNYYKLKQLILTEFAIAAKNNATGILWAQTNSTQKIQVYDHNDMPLLDPQGRAKTVTKQKALYMQLKELENNDLVVTDNDTSLQILQTKTGEAFWDYALRLVDNGISMSYNVPDSMFREGTGGIVGNAGLSQTHKSLMDSSIESVVQCMREEIMNRVVKPLLVFKFGKVKDYGEFTFTSEMSAVDQNARVASILSAVASGIFPADSPEIQQEIRKALGIPPQSEAEKADGQALKELNVALQWYNAQASKSNAESQIKEADIKQNQTQPPVEGDPSNYP